MINIAAPNFGEEEIRAVNDVLTSGMIAQGPQVARLEEDFANFCGTKYAVAVSSGTAAIHAALYALGIGPGDEVVTTPFSFIATVNPILMVGATPVLADILPESFNIDPGTVETAITSRTKAIIGVGLFGLPYEYLALSDIAHKYGIKLIEDACQSVGAKYGAKMSGSLGDIACFSLYATKNITAGEGGLLTTSDKSVAGKVRSFRRHGMVSSYEYEGIGYNYRMTDLHAAIATQQLKKIDSFTRARQQTAELYNEGLKGIPGIILPTVPPDRSHVYHQYTIRITSDFPLDRETLVSKLLEAGVGTGVYYPKPLHAYDHLQKLGYKLGDFPVAEVASRQVLSLPVHPRVSSDDAHYIIASIRELAK